MSKALERLAWERFHGIGERDYGPYYRGKRSLEWRVRMAREELADLHVYLIDMGRIDHPWNEAERAEVKFLIDCLWVAIDRLEQRPMIGDGGGAPRP